MLPNGEIVRDEGYQEGASPIEELEEYSTPEKEAYNEDDELLRISQEVKKKDQSRKMVLWEKDEMRSTWENSLVNKQ